MLFLWVENFQQYLFRSSEHMVEMQCMLQLSPATIVMGGHQKKLILYDIAKSMETNVVCALKYISSGLFHKWSLI
jgi:hypothetical protein